MQNNCADTNLSLELPLVKDLYCHNGRILYVDVKIPTETVSTNFDLKVSRPTHSNKGSVSS